MLQIGQTATTQEMIIRQRGSQH